MQFRMLRFIVIVCIVASGWQVLKAVENQKENWVEPNSWALEVGSGSSLPHMEQTNNFCMCNVGDNPDVSSDNQAALLIFRKFVRQLFSREHLQFNQQFSVFQRELLFTIHPAELEKLEQLEDPRDIDIILTEIFGNARNPNKYRSNSTWSSIFALLWDIMKDFVMLLRFSEVKFLMCVLVTVLIGWFIHRKHNIRLLTMIIGSFIVFGYFVTYLECNRELEIKQMLEVIENHEAAKSSENRWYSPITNWFGSTSSDSSKTTKQEQIKKASRLNLAFCRPDHVLMLYANDLFLKQLEFLLEKCTSTLVNLKNTLTFPYNYIAAIGLLFMIGFIIKLTFEHILSPRVWTGYFRQEHHPAPSQSQQALPSHDDRLSGENLKMLLSAINSSNVFGRNTTVSTISCVQEVVEPLNEPTTECDSSDSCNSSNSSKNTSISKLVVSPLDSSASSNVSAETAASELEITKLSDEKSDPTFVLISQLKTKVTLEDLPND